MADKTITSPQQCQNHHLKRNCCDKYYSNPPVVVLEMKISAVRLLKASGLGPHPSCNRKMHRLATVLCVAGNLLAIKGNQVKR